MKIPRHGRHRSERRDKEHTSRDVRQGHGRGSTERQRFNPRLDTQGQRSIQNQRTEEPAGLTALGAALDKARQSQSLLSLKTRNIEGLDEVTVGRLVRQVVNGHVEQRVVTEGGGSFILNERDALGVADRGRIMLVRNGGRLLIDPNGTDAVHSFVGTIEARGNGLVATTQDPRAPFPSLPLIDRDPKLIGQTGLIHVTSPLTGQRSGRVESLIPSDGPWHRTFAELATRMGVEATFAPEVLKDVARIKQRFDPDHIEGYQDFTGKYFFSIDNPYSKDFDQAMCIEPNPDQPGAFDVYYALADLGYFLDLAGPDSALAQRAARVQTTTYMPGFDFPVLPRDLSEGLVSLNQDEKRPAFVVKYTVGPKGEVSAPTFEDAVIINRRNGNYPEAQRHLDGEKVADADYAIGIERLKVVGERLLAGAEKRGMFSDDEGETWATINKKTGQLELEHRGQHWIERANAQISITANNLIGEYLIGHGAPAFHRRHDEPDPTRLRKLQQIARRLGVRWPPHASPEDVLNQLEKNSPLGRVLRSMVLRSMPRAYVSADPGSHHGLALAKYVQSTAPMRRSRDAFNHDSARRVRDGKPYVDVDRTPLVENARRAEDRQRLIESEVARRLAAQALSMRQGKTLDAEVSRVSPSGVELFFPELNVRASVPASGLPGGPSFSMADRGLTLRGQDGQQLSVGDQVRARVLGATPLEGEVHLQVTETISRPVIQPVHQAKPAQAASLEEVRGDGFESPFVGDTVQVEGIVTSVNGVGFFVQPLKEALLGQRGGLLVRSWKDNVEPGDIVQIQALVHERRKDDLPYDRSVVELVRAKVKVKSHRPDQLPEVIEIGGAGLPMLPADPAASTEYWRKLLGQRVRIAGGTGVSPSNRYGDLTLLPDGWTVEGAHRTPRGGLVMPPGGWNHQSVSLKFRPHVGSLENSHVGARFEDIEGVVIYRSGSFQIELSKRPQISQPKKVPPQEAKLVSGPKAVTVAGVNALNMHPGELDRAKVIARQIVEGLKTPDIIALQEIQDNDGPKVSDIVDASETYRMLIDEIKKAGGPEYRWFDLPPKNGADGGEPGGNIRVGFLYRADRVTPDKGSIQRVGERDPAFMDSRKPLAATFDFQGKKLLVVNNHFASRRGSSPWTSEVDPPVVGRADQRVAQAEAVRRFVDAQLEGKKDVDALVLGDFNDWPGSATYQRLTAGGFIDVSQSIPHEDRFDYNYRGTLQVLQAPIASPSLQGRVRMEFLHKSVYEPIEGSDHDPVLLQVQY